MRDVFVHERAMCETDDVGPRTRIWANAHILAGARIGADCNICDGVFVEGQAVIGDRVTIKCGVQVWDGVELSDDVFVGPNATFTNNPFPRSRQWLAEHPRTRVQPGASIGANATILPGLEIGRGAMIGAGAVVTRSVPAHAVVAGNPARILGYADSRERPQDTRAVPASTLGREDLGVSGAYLHRFPEFADLRGRLTVGEIPSDAVPFEIRRWFMVHDVPSPEIRGEHAHHRCEQFLICVSGTVTLAVDDGERRAAVLLDRPSMGVYVPPMVWGTQFKYGASTVLLVLASLPYDPEDYIRDYDAFLAATGRAGE